MKTCSRCRKSKPLDQFSTRTAAHDGRHAYCRPCNAAYQRERNARLTPDERREIGRRERVKRNANRELRERYLFKASMWSIKSRYGLEPQELLAMIEAQGGACAICGRVPTAQPGTGRRWQMLCVDHNGKTGKVRALLCDGCNIGLGSFGDDPERLEAAARYLRRHMA